MTQSQVETHRVTTVRISLKQGEDPVSFVVTRLQELTPLEIATWIVRIRSVLRYLSLQLCMFGEHVSNKCTHEELFRMLMPVLHKSRRSFYAVLYDEDLGSSADRLDPNRGFFGPVTSSRAHFAASPGSGDDDTISEPASALTDSTATSNLPDGQRKSKLSEQVDDEVLMACANSIFPEDRRIPHLNVTLADLIHRQRQAFDVFNLVMAPKVRDKILLHFNTVRGVLQELMRLIKPASPEVRFRNLWCLPNLGKTESLEIYCERLQIYFLLEIPAEVMEYDVFRHTFYVNQFMAGLVENYRSLVPKIGAAILETDLEQVKDFYELNDYLIDKCREDVENVQAQAKQQALVLS